MAKQSLPDFAPELRVVAAGTASNRLVVVFDTATDLDLKRSPRVVMIDTEGVTNITTEVTDVTTQELVDRALYQGKINLLTQKGEAEATRYLLAEFSLEVEGNGKRSKTLAMPRPIWIANSRAMIPAILRIGRLAVHSRPTSHPK